MFDTSKRLDSPDYCACMRTCDDHRLKGWFYVPESPDHRVPGILIWSQEHGADLELIGGLSPEPTYEQIDENIRRTTQVVGDISPGTIYGESDSGERITLWGADRGNYTAAINGGVHEEFWHAAWVCMGAHLPSADAPMFRDLTIALDDLYYLTGDGRFCAPQWASIEGVEQPGVTLEDGTLLLPYVLPVIGGHRSGCATGSTADTSFRIDTFATRPCVSPATEADPRLKLDFMTSRRRRGTVIELSVDANATIAPLDNSADSAGDLLRRAKPLLDLASLATFRPSGVEWMRARTVDDQEAFLLCHTGHLASPDLHTEPGGLVFTLDDVPLDSFLQSWQRITSRKQADYAWNLVVGLIGHSPRMVEEHIAQVLAAAEGFHTWCLASDSSTPLRRRLIDLHESLPESLKLRLQLDVDRWADRAVWARNHVAHGGSRTLREISDSYELKIIADSVRLVTYLAALKEFSVPNDKLATALSTHPRLTVLAERCSEIPPAPNTDA